MSPAAGALGFLLARTVRNRVVRQLKRVRQPRYAIALLIGLGYLWLVFAQPGSGARPASTGPGPSGTLVTLAGIGLAITVYLWWLKGGVSGSLAFQPAEVHYLFTAPLTRRSLIAYKVFRAQILILFNALLWMLLTQRWGVTIPAPFRFLTVWGLFAFLSLHRLLAALVQTPPVTGGRRVALFAARLLSAAGLVAILAGLAPVAARWGTLGLPQLFRAAGVALATPPAAWAIAPFGLVMEPLYAASAAEWLGAFALVALVVALHLVLVLGTRVEFEEAAATASAEFAKTMAAFKARRGGGPALIATGKARRTGLPLAPQGWPAAAIVWKNTIALIRTGALRLGIVVVVIVVVFSRVLDAAAGDEAMKGAAEAAPFIMIAGMAFLLGPRLVRNDLRQDLLSLSLLKTYPLKASHVVMAELASPTLVLSAFQLAMLVTGYFTISPAARDGFGGGAVRALAVTTPFAIVTLNAANVAIQNGMALLFPSWVRLGPDSGGIEAIGQNVLVMIGSLLALVLALILPLVSAGIGAAVARQYLEAGAAAAVGVAAGTLVLGAEIAAMVALLGRVFEKTEPEALA